MYCIPMIATGCFFQIFIFYASHQTRRVFFEKFIFHVELQREILKKCSAILVSYSVPEQRSLIHSPDRSIPEGSRSPACPSRPPLSWQSAHAYGLLFDQFD